MNTKTKSNLIASILLVSLTVALLALLAPVGKMAAGVAVLGALLGFGALELKQAADRESFLRGRRSRVRA